jgi:hypothetical protein
VIPDMQKIPEMVPLGLLRRYLAAHGWKLQSSPQSPPARRSIPSGMRALFQNRAAGKRNVDVYVLPDSDAPSVELLVPQENTAHDFERRLQGAILALSQVEERSPEQIIAAVRAIGFDVVQSRIPSDMVIDDTIHLENARSYINGMKDLLAATATTEKHPLPFFGRVTKDAAEYSERCRFGHTYRGSFGFTIESPVAADQKDNLFGEQSAPPFERRVIERLATGIQQVCDAARTENTESLKQAFRTGFSANGYERFATLVRNTAYSGMAFTFAFSPEWPVPPRLNQVAEFIVGPRHVEIARAAADALRGDPIEIPLQVSGPVVRLQNEADPSDLTPATEEGEISVLYDSPDYGEIHLRITLSPPEYLKAVEAHRQGRPITLSGTLAHKGRYWYLLNPSEITIRVQNDLNLEPPRGE